PEAHTHTLNSRPEGPAHVREGSTSVTGEPTRVIGATTPPATPPLGPCWRFRDEAPASGLPRLVVSEKQCSNTVSHSRPRRQSTEAEFANSVPWGRGGRRPPSKATRPSQRDNSDTRGGPGLAPGGGRGGWRPGDPANREGRPL